MSQFCREIQVTMASVNRLFNVITSLGDIVITSVAPTCQAVMSLAQRGKVVKRGVLL